MSLQPLIPALVLALVASVGGVTAGAVLCNTLVASIAGLLYATVVGATALHINRPLWAQAPCRLDAVERVHAVRRNTRLAALVYAWGAAGLFAAYPVSGLHWYHFWQYGLGAVLIAGGLLLLVKRMGPPRHAPPPPLVLTWLHAGAIAAGLSFLLVSGKLFSQRSDWPANVIFLWGGVTLIAICLISARTQAHLERRGSPA